jgi:8-oxo-dGTP pyrophosphatase MutT (NUDIX family)
MTMSVPEYSSVILLTTTGEIALQLRDDNPSIADPNCLSLFAGRLEGSETPEQGARRELQEETTLTPATLTFFMTYQTDIARFGRVARSHVFIVRDIDVSQIDVREGQGYRLIKTRKDLETHNFALISKEILAAYFDSLEK